VSEAPAASSTAARIIGVAIARLQSYP
jgi:hypothetical protein